MPRIGRLDIPGGCYHVMGRGLERRRIFNADVDKAYFLERLGEDLARSGAQCFAWALMSNHYHLLIRVSDKPLSKLMAPLLGSYAGYYNLRHRRSGYVFQNRYKSILCDEDSYLLQLIRYIHLNPLKAGILTNLKALDSYAWTGHAVLMGKRRHPWQSVDETLSHFAKRISTARMRYREFMTEGLSDTEQAAFESGGLVRSYGGWETLKRLRKEHIYCVGDERILGESDFIQEALAQDKLSLERRTQRETEGWTLEAIVAGVCSHYDIEESRLIKKARNNVVSEAKGLICFFSTEQLGLPMREVAQHLQISQPAVPNWVKKGEQYCHEFGITFEGVLS